MQKISLPQKPKFIEDGKNFGRFEIPGCHPGYGATLGNAIRRVLLSSLEGAAITSVKIKGASHEFSTLSGVMEDVIQIILNLKKIRFKSFDGEVVKANVSFKGEGTITAKDIKCPSNVEIINKDQVIATITDKKTEIEMEVEVGSGIGYVPAEQQEKGDKEIGVIAIDAIYTPVKRVNYEVENMRVGKRTDFDKITFEIETDGTIAPKEAFEKSVEILISQFSAIKDLEDVKDEIKVEKAEIVEDKEEETKKEDKLKPEDNFVVDLRNLSTRTLNVLENNNIKKVSDIISLSEEELKNLEGMGDKGVKEIKKAIGEFGLTLKQ